MQSPKPIHYIFYHDHSLISNNTCKFVRLSYNVDLEASSSQRRHYIKSKCCKISQFFILNSRNFDIWGRSHWGLDVVYLQGTDGKTDGMWITITLTLLIGLLGGGAKTFIWIMFSDSFLNSYQRKIEKKNTRQTAS